MMPEWPEEKPKMDIAQAGDMLIKLVTDRQFRILFDAGINSVGCGCPPAEFQPDSEDKECRVPSLSKFDKCLDCWREYTKVQALLDLGFIRKIELGGEQSD